MAKSADITNPIPRKCSVEGCGKPHYGAGYCNRHWQRFKKFGEPGGLEVMKRPRKVCTLCGEPAVGQSLCKIHHKRFLVSGDPGPVERLNAERGAPRAWLEAHRSHSGEDCLPWPFGRKGGSYGQIISTTGRPQGAHRAMCEAAHGPPPFPRADAAHSCGNRICVNPNHLRWATRQENCDDTIEHGRTTRGARNTQTKLKDEQVLAIYADPRRQRQVAESFGIPQQAVSKIKRGKIWAWLTGHAL